MSCECTPIGETRFGEELDRSSSMAIVQSVAAAEDLAPEEMKPLTEEIDLEAIDQLFANSDGSSSRIKL